MKRRRGLKGKQDKPTGPFISKQHELDEMKKQLAHNKQNIDDTLMWLHMELNTGDLLEKHIYRLNKEIADERRKTE